MFKWLVIVLLLSVTLGAAESARHFAVAPASSGNEVSIEKSSGTHTVSVGDILCEVCHIGEHFGWRSEPNRSLRLSSAHVKSSKHSQLRDHPLDFETPPPQNILS